MPRTEFGLVWSEEGGFDGDFDRFFASQVNGLVLAADPSRVYVNSPATPETRAAKIKAECLAPAFADIWRPLASDQRPGRVKADLKARYALIVWDGRTANSSAI